MRVDIWLYALIGLANASALIPRDPPEEAGYDAANYDGGSVDAADYHGSDTEDEYDYKKPDYKPDYKPEYPEPEYKKADYKPEYKEPEYKEPEYEEPEYKKPEYKESKYKEPEYKEHGGYENHGGDKKPWRPKTHRPEFFSLKVDDKCTDTETKDQCPFEGYAIRLEDGIAIATPYNKWWDPKLPIFFVDDDTQAYTVSKKPLQLYVNTVSGALRYAPVGWLPPNSVSVSFYKTGNNPLGWVDPSPAYFAWPTTQGRADFVAGTWWLCPISNTGQFQVFISDFNFGDSKQGGIWKDPNECKKTSLAAINASPWKSGGH